MGNETDQRLKYNGIKASLDVRCKMLWVLVSGGDWGKAFPEEVILELEIWQMRTFQAEGTSAIQNSVNCKQLGMGGA